MPTVPDDLAYLVEEALLTGLDLAAGDDWTAFGVFGPQASGELWHCRACGSSMARGLLSDCQVLSLKEAGTWWVTESREELTCRWCGSDRVRPMA